MIDRTPRLLWLALLLPLLAQAVPDAEESARQVDEALASWDVPGARKALEALRRVRNRVEVADFLAGRLAFEEGRYAEATKLLENAGVEDTPGSYLRLARDTGAVVAHHLKAQSEHFELSYPPGKDEILVPYALDTLERIRTALAEELGHTPPERVRVEIVNDARELSRVSTLSQEQIKTTGTIAICKFNKLMVTSPKAVLRGYDWRDTLAHEYVHLVVSQRTRNETPIWLQEGLAKYLESRWRGAAGLSMPPPTLALLGERVKRNSLIPFAKMHPSIALLPSHEDAAVAFAEVFFAVDLLYRQHGSKGLRSLLAALAAGAGDRHAVEVATSQPFSAFERAWLNHVKHQPFPKVSLSTSEETITLKDPGGKGSSRPGRELFWDFTEVREPSARRAAHLGELMRTRSRMAAAAEEFGKAYQEVGDKYPNLSNKYALSLLALKRLEEAERILQESLKLHPGSPATQVHLGRIYLARGDWLKAKEAFLDALAEDPFDSEIHISLTRVGTLLGDTALRDRARKASVLLTGMTPEQVDRLARPLGSQEQDLSVGPIVSPHESEPAPPDAGHRPGTITILKGTGERRPAGSSP